VALSDWNWRLPPELQDVPWDCAAASLAWALNTVGYPLTEQDVVAGLGSTRISPTYGLLDASGAGLVSYLAELGIGAANNPSASWNDIVAAAGYQPMVMGGRNWCHWTGVRIPSPKNAAGTSEWIALANPAPGWMNVYQTMSYARFPELGPFSAVWFTNW
jgi:hypothetical protein